MAAAIGFAEKVRCMGDEKRVTTMIFIIGIARLFMFSPARRGVRYAREAGLRFVTAPVRSRSLLVSLQCERRLDPPRLQK